MDQYEGFAAIYNQWSAPMTEDVAFYVDLAREALAQELAQEGGPIVELAVGTGRVAIPVAAATGQRVIGIDLLHLPTWADRRRVFERVAASLLPGGRFAWNAFAFDPKIAVKLDGQRQTDTGVPHRIDYIPADNRIAVTREDGSAIALWWIARSEWEGLIDVAGLEVEALYGWFDRRPFDDTSREFVFVARKPT